MSAFQLALAHLIRKRLPTLVALLALALSVATAGVLLRLYVLSNSRFSSMAIQGDAIVGAKAGDIDILLGCLNLEGPYPDFVPWVLYRTLKTGNTMRFEDGSESGSSYIRTIIPIIYFAKYKDYRVIGTDSTFLDRPRPQDSPHLVSGRWADSVHEVVLGSEVARREGLKVGSSISLQSWCSKETGDQSNRIEIPTRVVGVLAPTNTVWDDALFGTVADAQQIIEDAGVAPHLIWKKEVLQYFLVYLNPEGFAPLKSLINQRSIAQIVSVPEAVNRLKQLAGTGQQMGLVITLLIILLGGLCVTAMMISRFEGMSMQVAVLRAIGYDRRFIGRWLLWEGTMLGAAACVLGGLLDLASFPWIRAMLGSALPVSPFVHAPIYLSSSVWAAVIVATVLAVLIPVLRLNRVDVHSLLKGL